MAGVRFFKHPWSDINRRPTYTASNNQDLVEYLFTRDPFYKYTSTGANNDTVAVSVEIEFRDTRAIDTLIITKTNVKEFSLSRWTGSSWVVVISENNNTDDLIFREFMEFNTTKVKIDLIKTITPNQEKTAQDIHVCKSLGQLIGYPRLSVNYDPSITVKEMLSGRKKVTKLGEARNIKLEFKDHMGAEDRALFKTLATLPEPVLVWLCGGDADIFEHGDIGYAKDDFILSAVDSGHNHSFTKDLYFSGMNASLSLTEVA